MLTAQLWHFLAVHRVLWYPQHHFIYNLFHWPQRFGYIYAWARAHGFTYHP